MLRGTKSVAFSAKAFSPREGLLVRIEPDADASSQLIGFLQAKMRVSGGKTDRDAEEKELFCLETVDGPIEFFSERLSGTPGNLNEVARKLMRGGRRRGEAAS